MSTEPVYMCLVYVQATAFDVPTIDATLWSSRAEAEAFGTVYELDNRYASSVVKALFVDADRARPPEGLEDE